MVSRDKVMEKILDAMEVLYDIHPLLLGITLSFIGCSLFTGALFGFMYLVDWFFF